MSLGDSYCTPPWLTGLLPRVDLDPASNPRSTVPARERYMLEAGQDGLALPWVGSVWLNGPYSDLLPWADKLLAERGVTAAGVLVNVDTSTAWWRRFTQRLTHGLFFSKRIQFVPPPGVKPSTNNRPQALLMDDGFLAMCSSDLLCTGTLWSVQRNQAYVTAGIEA